jgi:4,5-DOPA dioxygenase extradiol
VLGSGQITHNLQEVFEPGAGAAALGSETPLAPYAVAFRDWVSATLGAADEAALLDWHERAPWAERAHPTPEHFLPLLVAFGAAGHRPTVQHLDFGAEGGVLAMDGYVFG